MNFSFSAVNQNADEDEIPFSAEKRKSQNLYLRLSCERNIFGPTQITFWNENEK